MSERKLLYSLLIVAMFFGVLGYVIGSDVAAKAVRHSAFMASAGEYYYDELDNKKWRWRGRMKPGLITNAATGEPFGYYDLCGQLVLEPWPCSEND